MAKEKNNNLKLIISTTLSTLFIISLAVNGWIYNELRSLNRDFEAMKIEQSAIQGEYEAILPKIDESMELLIEQQYKLYVKNMEAQVIKTSTQQNTSNAANEQPKINTELSKSTEGTTTPSEPSTGGTKTDNYTRERGVPGTFPKTVADQDGNGIDDKVEKVSGSGNYTTSPSEGGSGLKGH